MAPAVGMLMEGMPQTFSMLITGAADGAQLANTATNIKLAITPRNETIDSLQKHVSISEQSDLCHNL
jgi:hypothetical protein